MVENKFIKVDRESFPYVFVKDVDISLKTHEKGLAQVDWPIPDTQYTKFFLTPKQTLLQISDMSDLQAAHHFLVSDALNTGDHQPHIVTSHRFLLPSKARVASAADVEEWPTNTVLEPNETLVLEIAGRDTQGIGKILPQAPPDDRDPRVFDGLNPLELGKEDSWLLLPSFRLGKRAPVIV
ncbi:hypothetical protein V6000_006393 [Aspergillus fumigatus]